MPVPDLIVARNRHLRFASFSYRVVSHAGPLTGKRESLRTAKREYIVLISSRERAFLTLVCH